MNFDRLAPHYDWMETVLAGPRLQRARTAWLGQLHDRRRIVSAGEGHGRFAAACLAQFPDTDLTCIEASGKMLARAQHRLGARANQVRWKQSEVLAWQPKAAFDAVVTCFFLDCFPPDTLAAVIAHLANAATPDAIWLVADFALPPRGIARLRAALTHGLMYAFFRRVVALPAQRLTPPDDLLRACGFRLQARRAFDWGLIHADVWHRHA